MNTLSILIIILFSFGTTYAVYPFIKEMFINAGFVRPNFLKEQIPLGVGIIFFISALLVGTAGRIGGFVDAPGVYQFLFATGAMGLFGLIDDVFGTRHASGLKGHLKKLIKDRVMTTGALKALAGGFIALIISFDVNEDFGTVAWGLVLLDTLLIALSTNTVNLLDLRPGRAGKGFLILTLFLIISGWGKPDLQYLFIIIGSLLAFLKEDLNARAMMGDAGSNILGITIGLTAVFVLALPVKLGYFVFLVFLHVLTEKYSLTKIIEQNKLLNYFDMLGRKH